MKGSRRLASSLLVVLFLAVAMLGSQSLWFPEANASGVQLPVMTLTIVGSNGTQVVLNETDIAGLSSLRAVGGYFNQLGVLKGLGNYTGVSVRTLCDLVGVLSSTSAVNVIAVDNYSKTFTYNEVNGAFVTYDPETGANVSHAQPLVPMIAYHFNDTTFAPSDGPLRMAVVGPEELATGSTYWVKQVVSVEIVETQIPEFSSVLVLPLLFLTASAAVISLRSHRRSHCAT